MGNAAPVILISRTDRLGDVLLSFPAFHQVRSLFPQARIIILVRAYTAELLYNQHFIDMVLILDAQPIAQLIQIIKQEKPDYFIALFTDKQVGCLARNSGAKYRIGPLSKLHSWFSYNRGILQKRSNAQKNEAEYNLDLVNRLKSTTQDFPHYSKLYYPASSRQFALAYFAEQSIPQGSPIILISPFTGGSAKNLSLEQYQSLAQQICALHSEVHIIYTAMPNNPYQAILTNLHEREHLFINDGSIHNLMALIDTVTVFVGASTGPTHIAAFLQKAVVAIYPRIRNQSPIRWGVLGTDKLSYIQPVIPCPQKYGCKTSCPHYDCFSELNIAKIAELCCGYLP